MNIILTGADGYLGWPTALKLSKAMPEALIILVDNLGRRKWVDQVGSVSAIPICTMEERIEAARKHGFANLRFQQGDLLDYQFAHNLLRMFMPEVILHLAAQPSAPYSQIDAAHASFTQDNNVASTRNLLWALRQENMLNVHFIETTTTGIYGAPNFEIPEGDLEVIGPDGSRGFVPYPNMASSWYHVSKGFNAENLRLMNMQTGLPITDVRTSIVYGVDTPETSLAPELATRFDFDFYFGTLFNRWCSMAVLGHPLTIYGTGDQIKPVIHLDDAAQSLVQTVKSEVSNRYLVLNQLTQYVKIGELARQIADSLGSMDIKAEVVNIPNPRVEKESEAYRFQNSSFLKVLGHQPLTTADRISEVFNRLLPYKETLKIYEDRIMAR